MGKDTTTYELTDKARDAIARVEAARMAAMTQGVNVSPVTYTPDGKPKPVQA